MPDELTKRIIGAEVKVHRNLGPGLLESSYELALMHELVLRQINFERQVSVDVLYKEIKYSRSAPIICSSKVRSLSRKRQFGPFLRRLPRKCCPI